MPLEGKNILAIDDAHSILTFLRISLEAEGATFHGAATAAGGIALCESVQPDLVILDLKLPDNEGLIILPRLKRACKEKKLPVLVLTVHKEQEAKNAAQQVGADAYMTKPFIIDDLVNTVHSLLNIRREPHLTLIKKDGQKEKETEKKVPFYGEI